MSECVINHGTDKEGKRKRAEASRGRLCRNHASRLNDWLKDIAIDYTLLETVITPGASANERRSSSTESAPPLNLTVVALRDSDRIRGMRERGDELWYELPDMPSVVTVIHARAEDIRCLLDPTRDRDANDPVRDVTVIGEINYLLAAFPDLCDAEWIDEAFQEIKQVWIALQRAHDRPRPKPLGHCLTFDCDGTVWPRPEADPWCSKCKRIYESSAEWVKIAIQEETRQKKAAAG